MIKTLLFLSMLNSSVILISSHPISFGIILLLQTMLISICSRILTQSSWIPLTLFLVMIGGLMILFLYITSVCSNKKITFMKPNLFQIAFIIILINFMENFLNIPLTNESLNMKDLFNMEFTKLFLPLNIFSSNFMFLYLLIMLIIMIEIMSLNKGPMRKKY
uniref:NADH dehydrogenase subunit 6 n=1 Tax=Cacopsylla burckhardti TaxID=2593410 RepID=A0A8K1SPC5_9HEMI|nr:NADH dehydrogenase subunit 6 [Cacopsylla burckhardti]UFP91888.1 NADH dehydrogenase subunit 6 [Cacopsylla burckhardti]WAK85091.1 NADH dehydrogenase subunit 6 [Cacopsylla burckhardti]